MHNFLDVFRQQNRSLTSHFHFHPIAMYNNSGENNHKLQPVHRYHFNDKSLDKASIHRMKTLTVKISIIAETAMGVSRKTQDQSGLDYAMVRITFHLTIGLFIYYLTGCHENVRHFALATYKSLALPRLDFQLDELREEAS